MVALLKANFMKCARIARGHQYLAPFSPKRPTSKFVRHCGLSEHAWRLKYTQTRTFRRRHVLAPNIPNLLIHFPSSYLRFYWHFLSLKTLGPKLQHSLLRSENLLSIPCIKTSFQVACAGVRVLTELRVQKKTSLIIRKLHDFRG